MSFPMRRLCGRMALIVAMLVGGLLAASMSPADADDGGGPTAAISTQTTVAP